MSDVAKAMGLPIGTVRTHWYRYRQRGTMDEPARGGSDRSTRTDEFVASVKSAIDENPNISIRALARKFNVSHTVMGRVVREDLGLKSLAVVRVQQLTPKQIQGRADKGKIILNLLKREAVGKILVYSDEKDFHVDKYLNRRNSRTIAECAKAANK